MPSLQEAVEQYLEVDATLADGLVRGIVDLRRAAQWLASEEGWTEPEEDIMHCFKKWTEEDRKGLIGRERKALESLSPETRLGLSMVKISKEDYLDHSDVDVRGIRSVRTIDACGEVAFILPSRKASMLQRLLPSGTNRVDNIAEDVIGTVGRQPLQGAVARLLRVAVLHDISMEYLVMTKDKAVFYRDSPSACRIRGPVRRMRGRRI